MSAAGTSFLLPNRPPALHRPAASSFATWRASAVSTGRESSPATPTLKSVVDHGAIARSRRAEQDVGGIASEPPMTNNLDVRGDDEAVMIGQRRGLDEFFEMAEQLVRSDGGPPRWFAPLGCGPPSHNSPLLLYLPGIDGTGAGLALQQRKLGRIFELWCLHIPVMDRTPFVDLVKVVEGTVRSQMGKAPGRPIYLVGESIGACIALSVASLNRDLDLVLILINPATSFDDSPIQPLLPLLDFIPEQLLPSNAFLLSLITGSPAPMFSSKDLLDLTSRLSVVANLLPKETLIWKLRMIKASAAYTNSRIHAIKAQTLILASGKDQLLPSRAEGERLYNTIGNSDIRRFPESGHFLLLEEGFDLTYTMKGVSYYRRGKIFDLVKDYLPPTSAEIDKAYESIRLMDGALAPVYVSTLEDGTIVKGLAGIPSEGPVLLVGYHMLMGWDTYPLVARFVHERKIVVRGIAHPMLFLKKKDGGYLDESSFDNLRLMGAVPVSGPNLYKLLSSKSHILLYPGGMREALHRKGEQYQLFWPEQSEFVRMAARFGAKIVPFGAVGEDDVGEVVLDFDDLMRIPFYNDYVKDTREKMARANVLLRSDATGEVANQDSHTPGIMPKFPGRFYYRFGKPIETEGRKRELRDREKADELYRQVQSEVRECMSYLKEKREGDPYRNIIPRLIHQAANGFASEVPTFEI
ncbi:hypothetical protein MLD38_013119 [Melastoma candidum]|uniref:Uncharacterized protein n=1 Tax=Melastoma candidum TaxID=119954 RepID=A0ACB9R8I3_9MYRT|nr:hypothetical protein MLD38_013119 [Melastoma candidum]